MAHASGPSRRAVLGLIGAAAAVPRAGLAASVEAISGAAFGTFWRISAPPGVGIARLAPKIATLFAEIDLKLSPWRPDSAISRFNAGHARARATDPAMIDVTVAALEIAAKSEGTFDPTVGPLVARWGFGPIDRGGAPDWRALSAGLEGVRKARADLTLDLCGIAKGWALDQVAVLAREAGLSDLLLELGGEFIALGRHPDGRDWRVAVEAPVPSQSSPATMGLPAGIAVATSGTRAQSYTLDGRLYSHIVDPRTLAPVTGGLRSVTVVAEDAMTADGWATALCAAGGAAGPDLGSTHGISALFLIEYRGALRQVLTGAIRELLL